MNKHEFNIAIISIWLIFCIVSLFILFSFLVVSNTLSNNESNNNWQEGYDNYSQGFEEGYSVAESKLRPLYKGSNSFLLEKEEPFKTYNLKNNSIDLVNKNGFVIDSLSCHADSCDGLNAGGVCLMCDYNLLANSTVDEKQKKKKRGRFLNE